MIENIALLKTLKNSRHLLPRITLPTDSVDNPVNNLWITSSTLYRYYGFIALPLF